MTTENPTGAPTPRSFDDFSDEDLGRMAAQAEPLPKAQILYHSLPSVFFISTLLLFAAMVYYWLFT